MFFEIQDLSAPISENVSFRVHMPAGIFMEMPPRTTCHLFMFNTSLQLGYKGRENKVNVKLISHLWWMSVCTDVITYLLTLSKSRLAYSAAIFLSNSSIWFDFKAQIVKVSACCGSNMIRQGLIQAKMMLKIFTQARIKYRNSNATWNATVHWHAPLNQLQTVSN